MTATFAEAIIQFITSRLNTKLDKLQKKRQKALHASDNTALAALHEDEAKLREEYQPANWLMEAAQRAKHVTLITHSVKYINSCAKGTNINALLYPAIGSYPGYLTSISLEHIGLDAISNAAHMDVAAFLTLQANGQSLHLCLANHDSTPFKPFVENEKQLTDLMQGFQKALKNEALSTHPLAKQLYFPVNERPNYHLISPLFPTSLAQHLYETIDNARYSDKAKQLYEAKRHHMFTTEKIKKYVKLAHQRFGGGNPQNVSLFNARRNGEIYLLNAEPPTWQSQTLPPLTRRGSFMRLFEKQVYPALIRLKSLLEQVKNKNSNFAIRKSRGALVDEIIDIFLHCAATIIQTKPAGWSMDSSLTKEEKFWLDPYFDDPNFQAQREQENWKEKIIYNFANWLNHKLERLTHEQLKFKDEEHAAWAIELKRKLNLLNDALEDLTR
ncbi:type I-F CRISPR-associated protein Csy1 [Legionella septentrionalis]|uniref:type I-F CRISPR-associated protein Csy1 n=1 Tax=Legionella septentrionalis TaxID=2498109 RepID=UPI000F8F48CB|nr:type I-F CRISPR-associated protein Csy1 [Legionella septentrionalis]RUQ97052.1 type I-F CRISPR-associated protein Csy1 [Legionella septentrionalis]